MHFRTSYYKQFYLIFSLLLGHCYTIKGQTDSSNSLKIKYGGYIETYYLYDFAENNEHIRPDYFVSYNRENEFNLNLGLLSIAAENSKVKAALGLMAGTYVNANLAREPGVLKNIYEANIGVNLNEHKNIWLTAGIFNSHIGFESAIGIDSYTLTRSLACENSPYYETGVKVNYESLNKKWLFSSLVLNGWQNIQKRSGSTLPSFGSQITYSLPSLTINSSTYIGNEGTDKYPIWRYFHNFYLNKKIGTRNILLIGADIGLQQNILNKQQYFFWYTPQILWCYHLSKKMNLSFRLENFYDPEAVIINAIKGAKFNVFGQSLNIDYKIINNVQFRIELKELYNQDAIFKAGTKPSNFNTSLTIALAARF
jgi:hypothetical protein